MVSYDTSYKFLNHAIYLDWKQKQIVFERIVSCEHCVIALRIECVVVNTVTALLAFTKLKKKCSAFD